MALGSIFGNIGSALRATSNASNIFSSIASPVQQILGAVKKQKNPVNYVQMPSAPEAESYSVELLKELANPNSALLASLSAEENSALNAAQQSDIMERILADRRERAMGRANVFFDPERTDENISYQVSRAAGGLQSQARSNALNRILAAAKGVGGFAPAQTQREQTYRSALGTAQEGRAMQPSKIQRMQSGIGGLQQILDIFNNKTTLPNGETIQWNQMRY